MPATHDTWYLGEGGSRWGSGHEARKSITAYPLLWGKGDGLMVGQGWVGWVGGNTVLLDKVLNTMSKM